MNQHETEMLPPSAYREIRIGRTIYRVTSVFSGEKELGKALEQIAVRRAMLEGTSAALSG
ncbi:MAG: hypothetical protein LUC94_09285 [Clostridiales bacterium]|nr:hypothetical protein [Clostridiales bacterium]